MKKLKKSSFDNLSKHFRPLNLQELRGILAGGDYSTDCVLNCYSYFSSYSQEHYNNCLFYFYGYTTQSNGGVKTSDITSLGSYGGLNVTELKSTDIIKKDGTCNGKQVMMTFNDASTGGKDHAVVITGLKKDNNGGTIVTYYDPTTGLSGTRTANDWSGTYSVSQSDGNGYGYPGYGYGYPGYGYGYSGYGYYGYQGYGYSGYGGYYY